MQIIAWFYNLRFIIYKRLLSNTRKDLKGRHGENSVQLSEQHTAFKWVHNTPTSAQYTDQCTIHTTSAQYTDQCTVHRPVHNTPTSAQYTDQCTVHHPVHNTPPSAQYTTQCTIHRPVHSTPPSAQYTTQCTLHHPEQYTSTYCFHYNKTDIPSKSIRRYNNITTTVSNSAAQQWCHYYMMLLSLTNSTYRAWY